MTRNIILMLCIVMALPAVAKKQKQKQELFPDGTPIPQWFSDTTKVNPSELGKKYVITDYGVKNDSTVIQTAQIQKVIDMAAANGGGVVVVPEGTFLTGALFFKPATHLHLLEGGRLKGSDRIADFPILSTRIEGETCDYFAALINAHRRQRIPLLGGILDPPEVEPGMHQQRRATPKTGLYQQF